MPQINKIGTRYIILAILLNMSISVSAINSVSFNGKSPFSNVLRSQLSNSIIGTNTTYFKYATPPEHNEQGIKNPFQSWDALYQGVQDYFYLKPNDNAIFKYVYQDSSLAFQGRLNMLAGYEHYINPYDYHYGFWYKGVRYQHAINRNWTADATWWSGAFIGKTDSTKVSSLIDSFYKADKKDQLEIDNFNGKLQYQSEHLHVVLGRGKYQFGNSVSGSIVLSTTGNDYGYILSEIGIGKFCLSSMQASLIADSSFQEVHYNGNDNPYSSEEYPDKYLAIHVLTYAPTMKTEIYAGESVIYGNRSLDMNYVLPFGFWRAIEHNLRDRDNMLVFAGFNYRPFKPTLCYGNILFDEFRYGKIFSNWWGNKYAAQVGVSNDIYTLDKHGLSDVFSTGRITIEATAVRPWTYTHKIMYNKYSNDDFSLGYPKGSNLINLTGELNLPLNNFVSIDSKASYTKQGSIGNSFTLNYAQYISDSDNETTGWLEGDKTETVCLENNLKLEVLAHHNIKFASTLKKTSNWKHSLTISWQMVF